MYRVLVTDTDLPSIAIEAEILAPLGADMRVAMSCDEETLVGEASSADVILAGYAPISAAVIDSAAASGCRAIIRYGIGVDNIDVEAATRRGIPVGNVPDYCLEEVADHTILLMLAQARRLADATASVHAGGWEIRKDAIRRLSGRSLGLIGVGRIGSKVANRARAFGLRVEAFDPGRSVDLPDVLYAETLRELLERSDFISLHAPLMDSTRHIIDTEAINTMRRAPVLINTARGGLVDLDAVITGLDTGRLSGVALDVVEPEPLPSSHPLRRRASALITPHMAYYSIEAETELVQRVAREAARAIRREPLSHPVSPIAIREDSETGRVVS